MRFLRILVGIDNSPLGSRVFAAALGLAQSNNAAMKLFHCLTPAPVSDLATPMTLDTALAPGLSSNADYQTQQILIEHQIEDAQAILKHYHDEALSYGVSVESNYEVGETGYQLCKAAREWGADLIVIGRRGKSGLTEALLGSVSNYVVHHAPCSVLVIQEVELEGASETIANEATVTINPTLSQEPA
jgi:nucleotide-binding universal stress UspA family protein